MAPKKNKKNQDDDELDRKFEQKQALLNQNQQKLNQENDELEEDLTQKKNIFEQIKQINNDTQNQKKKKEKQQKEQQQQQQPSQQEKTKEQPKKKQQQEKKIQKEEKEEEENYQQEDLDDSDQEEIEQENLSDSDSENEQKQDQKKESETAKKEKVDKKKLKKEKEAAEKEKKAARKEKQKDEPDQELFKSNPKDESYCDPLVVIFFVATLALMFVFKYYGDNYRRYSYQETSDNLYGILEVESSASAQEIKNSYKRLANIWHPDKNPNCGESCIDKFYKITEAWKVLGNAQKRENYDSTNGVLQQIKSKAITLNEYNYDQLVMQSTDVWIIQIYMNGDDSCKRMSPFWETIINTYGHIVKFGRVNAEIDYKLVQRLPIPSRIFPTIFSFSHYDSPQLATFSSYNIEAELAKFVQKSVISKLIQIKQEQASQLYKEMSKFEPNKKIDIVYLFQLDRIPIEFKYAALQNYKEFNFYTNAYGQSSSIQSSFQTSKNFIVFINDEEKQVRNKYEFEFGRKFNAEKFYKILNYLNFRATPEISKENFKYYCKNQQTRLDEESEFENDYQTLCIFLFKQSPYFDKFLESANKYRKQYKSQSIEKFTSGERIFDNFHNIQFVVIDLNKHWKFRNTLEAYLQDPKHNHPLKQLHAAAFLEENKKIALLNNINEFDDWILDLQDNIVDFEYLNDYLSSQDESSLFQFSQDTPLKMLLRSLKNNAIDYKTVMTVILGFVALLFKYNAHIALYSTITLLFVSVTSLSIFETYEEFLYQK
ncbi:DnaJ domain protein (macronuclear) [Tetrahymena thermophila SB210]|uniref:DnaJ domain protein n=1 Tax=Tetrahymena thermophila (strain SB210) TaxID=312017 RepID=I7MI06_TETTS|nr:DnaJ domain protein [Tetrahymena thermophila SB210]EAR90747.2 DnaJ domain protein [Tetrahymena thermophila SB210]|eukprot:XP_001010992.2 DnaJ domain protein [Tetrahymena thermophila SB210]